LFVLVFAFFEQVSTSFNKPLAKKCGTISLILFPYLDVPIYYCKIGFIFSKIAIEAITIFLSKRNVLNLKRMCYLTLYLELIKSSNLKRFYKLETVDAKRVRSMRTELAFKFTGKYALVSNLKLLLISNK